MKTMFKLTTDTGLPAGSAEFSGAASTGLGTVTSDGLVEVLLEQDLGSYPDPSGFTSQRDSVYFVRGVLQRYANRRGWKLRITGDSVPELKTDPGLVH